MSQTGSRLRLAVLSVVATAVACGLAWKNRELIQTRLGMATRAASVAKKSKTPARKTPKPPTDNSLTSDERHGGGEISTSPRPTVDLAATTRGPTHSTGANEAQKALEALPTPQSTSTRKSPVHSVRGEQGKPQDHGLAWRAFQALDRNGNGRLEANEIPERRRAALAKHAAVADSIGFEEFLRGLAAIRSERAEDAPNVAAEAVGAGVREAPVYRPKSSRVKLPAWFIERDANGDGQISMAEWPAAEIERFRMLDRNGDGFITPDEAKEER